MATILVVDDHAPTRELLRALFEYRGNRVLAAQNGPEAIVLAAEANPDLIVADIVMPGMDGYTFLRMLREHTACKSVPVVLMSASLEEGKARALAAKCGAADYIAKPFAPERMLALDTALSEKTLCAAR
jgi:CheY-like chemotaxis protein